MRTLRFFATPICTFSLLLSSLAIAQATPANPPQAIPSATGPDVLVDGTPIKLRLAETISSSSARSGQEVPFEVVEDISLNGVTIISKGAMAVATVTDAEHKKTMGRGGKLDINIDSVRLVDQEKVQLRAVAGGKAGGHTGAMTGAMVATGILFFPAAPLFLFMHGKDITLAKGMETTAFVDGDTHLNLAALSESHGIARQSASTSQQVAIDSDVPNCDILVDGAFVGSTPSTVSLAAGKHSIAVRRKGFTDWTRDLQSSGGSITLHAEMQATATP